MDEEMCWLQSFCSLQPLQPRNSQAQAVFGENRWMFLVKLGRNLTPVPHLNFAGGLGKKSDPWGFLGKSG